MNRRGFILGVPALVLGSGMTRGFWTPEPLITNPGAGYYVENFDAFEPNNVSLSIDLSWQNDEIVIYDDATGEVISRSSKEDSFGWQLYYHGKPLDENALLVR